MPKKNGDAKAVKTIEDFMRNISKNKKWTELKDILDEHPFEILHRNDYSFREISKLLGCSKASISHTISPGQKDKTRTRRIKSKTTFDLQLKEMKETTGCAICGKTFPYYALEFDHISGDKVETVSNLKRSKGQAITMQEVNDKCQVLCIHCHRTVTLLRELKDNFKSYTTSHQDQKEISFQYVSDFIAGKEPDKTINKRKMNIVYLKNLKESKPCVDCQETFPYYLMDFDHIEDNKVDNISKLVRNAALQPILDEVAKCELVCAHCHTKRSNKRRTKIYKNY